MCRAVEWLVDNSLVDDETARRFVTEHPDTDAYHLRSVDESADDLAELSEQ